MSKSTKIFLPAVGFVVLMTMLGFFLIFHGGNNKAAEGSTNAAGAAAAIYSADIKICDFVTPEFIKNLVTAKNANPTLAECRGELVEEFKDLSKEDKVTVLENKVISSKEVTIDGKVFHRHTVEMKTRDWQGKERSFNQDILTENVDGEWKVSFATVAILGKTDNTQG